jgi:5-methyltetrahydrofolate--homocysteine methyltransferase
MKRGVAYLTPFIEDEKQQQGGIVTRGKIVMATVKGDVHDIGKNIVGVVLGCNNYAVIDLGVMVGCENILRVAAEEKADAIGLSGLITPSLDEMGHVASEMQRQGFVIPLLIGGATTSRQHTAVKIAPAYNQETVHVNDAARAVGVLGTLLDPAKRVRFAEENRSDQARLRELFADRRAKPLLSFGKAQAKRPHYAFDQTTVAAPSFTGRKLIDSLPLEELRRYIDWTFFFTAWQLKGKYPAILESEKYGEAARELFDHGQTMLDELIAGDRLRANAVYGFWPAACDGGDLALYADTSREEEVARFFMLRQQQDKGPNSPCLSLADFVAPRDAGVCDHVAGFAVTTGIGVDALCRKYEAEHDDYSSIMVKALADRLAEAGAEWIHERIRRDWGYEDASLSKAALIAEDYRGIRPAFGYPACPDHSEKRTLFELLEPSDAGLGLTESCAMTPAASVSGLCFAHPEARYFNIGRVSREQLQSYSERKQIPLAEAERWLRPNLNY